MAPGPPGGEGQGNPASPAHLGTGFPVFLLLSEPWHLSQLMALETGSKARIQTRAAASLPQADPRSRAQPVSLTWGPMPRPHPPTAIQAAPKAPAGRTFWSYRNQGCPGPWEGVQVSRVPHPRNGSGLSHLKTGPGMRPGHTEEGVRLRDSPPLSQRLPHLPHPARPPMASWERSSITSSRPRFLFLSGTCGS